jgi:steroid delta-isomerase-like uncharacterized protein
MTTPTSVATRFYELFSPTGLDRLIDLVDDDYVGHGFGGGGRDRLRQSIEGFLNAFPDITFTIDDTITEGDKVAVKTTMRGTHQGPFAGVPASGNPIEVGSCDVLRVVDGTIVEAWWLGDSGTMFMQIGAIPMPAGA